MSPRRSGRRGRQTQRRRAARSAGGAPGASRLFLLVLAALAIAAGLFYYRRSQQDDVPAVARTAYHDEIGTGRCADILNTHECAAAIESDVLPALGERAVRRGNALVLRLSGADSVLLDSGTAVDDVDQISYHLVGMLPSGHFVVHAQRYEGSFYLLVNRETGEEHEVWAAPIMAPGGERMVAASADVQAGYNPNGFQIWRLRDGRLALEWSFEPDMWGPVDVEWIDDGAIRFVREGWCEDGSGFCRTPAVLERRAEQWAYRDTGPPERVW